MPTALWTNDRWTVGLPEYRLTSGHLMIIDRHPGRPLDIGGASSLIDAYRRARGALQLTAGSRGFAISFAVNWRPDERGIGEPEPISATDRLLHVFGRGPDDHLSPVRAMALPRSAREPVCTDQETVAALSARLETSSDVVVPAPADDDCDGCAPGVLTDQERWRADGVRVIRPHHLLIDSQVLVLPLRHVVSLADLRADEVVSIAARLGEALAQFGLASGSGGLSCFANDGTAARQETPHVHLHVFGRSATEAVNPFELLGQRLGITAERPAGDSAVSR